MLAVLAPVSGHSFAVAAMEDPVFSRGLVGPGLALRPKPGRQAAVAPVPGTLVKLHPHAFVVQADNGQAVLTHLGIDTVRMPHDRFRLLAREEDTLQAGDPVVEWDPAEVEASGRSAVCAVIVLGCDPATVVPHAVNADVAAGDLLFEVDC